MAGRRVGIAHHFGWAVAVTSSVDHAVVDRRRIELVEPGVTPAPIHYEGGAHALHGPTAPLDDAALARLVADVRASTVRATTNALDQIEAAAHGPIETLSLRAWAADFPTDVATQRRTPYESTADSVMYRQVLAELGRARGWAIHFFSAHDVEAQATRLLGARAHDVLRGPRSVWGPPWSKDHRIALAATIVVP